MKVNYVKRIEKMKKELQSKQMTIGLPTLIFIEYSGDKKKYRIELKDIGVVMATKICGVLIRNLAKARNEIYSFFAGCTEHDDGTKVTVDELKEMKFTEFIKIVRAFFGAAEIITFANDVADAMGVSVDQEQTAAEIPTV